MTELDIIIVSHNTRQDLDRCLRSVHESRPRVSFHLIVVENASGDGSAAMVRAAWPAVRVIETGRNLGFARANNIGIRATSSPLVLLLNSDTLVPPGTIDALVADLLGRPEVAVVGPRIVDPSGRPEVSFGRMITPFNELRQKTLGRLYDCRIPLAERYVRRLTGRAHNPDWVSGACLLVRRSDAEAVGLLDERFFMFTEDVDFCASIRKAGRVVRYSPEVAITHLRGRSVRVAPAATERVYRLSQMAFYEKHLPCWAPWLRAYLRIRGKLPVAVSWERADRD